MTTRQDHLLLGVVRLRRQGHRLEVRLPWARVTVSWGWRGGPLVREVHYRRLDRGAVLLLTTAGGGVLVELDREREQARARWWRAGEGKRP